MLKMLLKHSLVLAFSLFTLQIFAQHEKEGEMHTQAETKKKAFDANEVIFGHVLDGHEYHFLSYKGADGHEKHVTLPLPVILYSPQKGFSMFMSSKFEHGHAEVDGYKLIDRKIVPVDPSVKVYDLSLTRNVVQMILALLILCFIMIRIANKYKKGYGVTSAPKGLQNVGEMLVAFIRDEVAKPNLGHKYEKYMPYLLTLFFFILINNILGLIPGSANVTGNIAFTVVLGVISFFVIVFSSNKHFWGHIFNPPGVPGFVKPILILVEFLGVFIKPFALIIRLFANMVAGHIIIICLISLIFIFGNLNKGAGWGASPLAIGFTIFIYFIEILVAFLQAYIFTNLTAVFVGLAFEGDHAHEGDHAATAHAH
jgi:F-type H+-transporting ATPase subunit a